MCYPTYFLLVVASHVHMNCLPDINIIYTLRKNDFMQCGEELLSISHAKSTWQVIRKKKTHGIHNFCTSWAPRPFGSAPKKCSPVHISSVGFGSKIDQIYTTDSFFSPF